jgi:hypothetical protein
MVTPPVIDTPVLGGAVESLHGTVERVTFHSKDSGYRVLLVIPPSAA